jgi:hypothetical protein
MSNPNNMTSEELIDAIAEQIVLNISRNEVWTIEEWVKDTLIRGIVFVPLVSMTREELLAEWDKVMEDDDYDEKTNPDGVDTYHAWDCKEN